MFSWHSSSPFFWPKMELEILRTSFCPVTYWSCSLGNIQALSWIFFYVTRASFVKLQLLSSRWVCGVVRVLKSSSFSYLQSCRVCVCVCVCVCVGFCLLTPVLLTHPHNQQSLSTLSVPCRMLLSALKLKLKTRCSLILKSLKILWDTDPKLQSMPQVLSLILIIKFT